MLAACMLLCAQPSAFAEEPDTRMQIAVIAATQGVEVRWLHANIQRAATMALPQLWNRLIPRHAHGLIPKKVNAIRFLKKAVPTEKGVNIIFDQRRVLSYLKNNNVPYYVEQSVGHSETGSQIPGPVVDGHSGQAPLAQTVGRSGLLTIQRQASLPEQVLFEDDLGRDPHVVTLLLRQVNRQGRQYRLSLKGPDDQWLFEWIKRRGMTLTASVEGWVVR
ncbi:MAG: hypothetical protein Q9M12_00525 [Mariprofundus sp.]|nr:hypothetical protein [Mariprofundus sp.]